MKNQNSLFVVFCLCLTVGLLGVYSVFIGYFNGHQEYEMRLSALRKQVDSEKFNNSLLSYQLKDFQQTVAQVLPDNKKLQAKYELKNLASSVRAPASDESIDLSPVLFEKGKKYFNSQSYDKAIRSFSDLVEKYPLSNHHVEARFFIAESYFLKKDFKSCLQEIDTMVSQYPDNDLTGFILLRMGQISEINNQTEEASEVYQAVQKNFKNDKLKQQARKLAQSVEFK
ncbi:tetratricopeptide repeat protein [Bdellovibrio svalbardensis]|uniref:Outer membrane protein assembly factor BamD n=1 Tax=Bdellovibrio svalbardensis TaxID=2972972 RepID=A0ABT6DIB3_9BACT|nr:outer membrane protein assembly factor BamD [Bdellovibrio svalbardensis]MDG0816531.1 outer membrane protein assembly factor BamD [Bdellovibrio svalbardensis]